MPMPGPAPETKSLSAVRWLPRVVVLAALAATVWFAGPRAWRVLASRLNLDSREARSASMGPLVATARLAPLDVPDWLRGDLMRAVLQDFEPRLAGAVRLMDEPAAVRLQARLRSPAD